MSERHTSRGGGVRVARAAGFTLIELLVVLAVLGVLATIAVPVGEVIVQRHKEAELRLALREIRNAIDAYKRAYDEGHMLRSVNSTGYPKTLGVLVEGVEDAKDPKKAKMYFLRRLPADPMAPGLPLDAAASWAKRAYASEPGEPKEGEDVYDVFSRSGRIGLNGVPYGKW